MGIADTMMVSYAGKATVSGEMVPVICGTYSRSSRQRSQRIVDALYRLQQEDADFHVVDASDLPLLRDRLHFDAQGAETLGHRVYDVLRTLP